MKIGADHPGVMLENMLYKWQSSSGVFVHLLCDGQAWQALGEQDDSGEHGNLMLKRFALSKTKELFSFYAFYHSGKPSRVYSLDSNSQVPKEPCKATAVQKSPASFRNT